MKNNTWINLLLAIILLSFLGLMACNSNRLYKQETDIPNNVWDYTKPIEFTLNVQDNSIPYDLNLLVRHGSLYPSSNLWLFVSTSSPSGKSQTDTVECLLTEPKGAWLGDGMGDIWDLTIAYKRGIKLVETGTYKMKITQGMRMEQLPQIMSIGVEVNRSKLAKN